MSSLSLDQKPHILVVDDDDRLRGLLRRYLAEQGFIVTTSPSAIDAAAKMKSLTYDLMVLDVMMPVMTGLELTQKLRDAAGSPDAALPILLLTARGESEDRIDGLEAGADDYLQKPFEPRELLLRINAILRRSAKPVQTQVTLSLGAWTYDPQRDELISAAETVRLTDMEAGLMRALAATPGQALSRDALAERSRPSSLPNTEISERNINDRTVDVQVTRLRRKIEPDAKNPRYLVTVRGEGYMLLPDAER